MPILAKIDPVERVTVAQLRAALSAPERRAAAAAIVRRDIDDAQRINAEAFGEAPSYAVTVDGRRGAPLESVNPDGGSIVVEFDHVAIVLRWIARTLENFSPVKSGDYMSSHELFADGALVNIYLDSLREDAQYMFVATAPYSRRLEVGKDRRGGPFVKQVPPHIVERVAKAARARFSRVATIRFGYTALHGSAGAASPRARSRDRWQALHPMITVQFK